MAEEQLGFSASWTESWADISTDSDNSSSISSGSIPADKSSNMSMVYVQVLLSPLVFLGNVLILVAIRRSKSMKRVTYLFLGHLAVADLLFGIGMCTRFFLIITDSLYKYPCLINQCFVITAGGSSSTGIFFLSLEGYLSVKYFMSFKRVFTPRLAWVLIVGCWFLWVSLALLSVILAAYSPVEKAVCSLGGGYYKRWYLIIIPSVYFCHLVLVMYYQLGTVAITRRHFAQLNPQMQFCANGNIQSFPQDSGQRRRLRRLFNLSKLVGMVLVVFLACWTPSMVGLYLIATCEQNCLQLSKTILNLASLLVVSSFMNVVIYAVKSPEFRNGFRQALRPRCNRVAVRDSTSSHTLTSHLSNMSPRQPVTSSTRLQINAPVAPRNGTVVTSPTTLMTSHQ